MAIVTRASTTIHHLDGDIKDDVDDDTSANRSSLELWLFDEKTVGSVDTNNKHLKPIVINYREGTSPPSRVDARTYEEILTQINRYFKTLSTPVWNMRDDYDRSVYGAARDDPVKSSRGIVSGIVSGIGSAVSSGFAYCRTPYPTVTREEIKLAVSALKWKARMYKRVQTLYKQSIDRYDTVYMERRSWFRRNIIDTLLCCNCTQPDRELDLQHSYYLLWKAREDMVWLVERQLERESIMADTQCKNALHVLADLLPAALVATLVLTKYK